MLGFGRKLSFPRLLHQRRETIKGKGWDKNVSLFMLDWKAFEDKKEEHHKEWNQKYWPNQHMPFVPFPEPYKTQLDQMLFALDDGYYLEVVRNSVHGHAEWCHSRPFDSCVRDYCLDTAKAHIDVAFYLLADCVYDPITKYFVRQGKNVVHRAMLYRFWMYQTGGSVVLTNAHWEDWNYGEIIRGRRRASEHFIKAERPELSNLFVVLEKRQDELKYPVSDDKQSLPESSSP